MTKIVVPYLLFEDFGETLDHDGWTGKRAWASAWEDRWVMAPRLHDVWPEICPTLESASQAYMRCVRVRFEPLGESGPAADEMTDLQISPSADQIQPGDTPVNCKVIAEYSSRELDEDRISFKGKIDVLEVGFGRTWNGAAGGRLESKVHKLFPYQEVRVTKALRTDAAQGILAADMANREGKVNDDTFEVGNFSWPAETVLFLGIDADTWEVSNELGLSYAHLQLLYRAVYVFGIRFGVADLTWNKVWRPRYPDKYDSGHNKLTGGDLQWTGDAGEWNTLTPPLYETADFDKMWTEG